jgi:UTP--glucose-1-phosphate uridylyltransferase
MSLKAVITAAGIGTRMLPATKEVPKEMLPVIYRVGNRKVLVPTLQVVFESLYDVGIREFCFVVNRFKRVIENHFSPDDEFIEFLKEKGKEPQADDMNNFYNKVAKSIIVYVNQYTPLGFGHAVLITKSFVGNDDFIVHAGDDFIVSKENRHLKRLIEAYSEYNANIALLLEEADDPRKYGVVRGEFLDNDIFRVDGVVEKPRKPPTNLAVVAVYLFNKKIFDALNKIQYVGGELPLSNAIDYIAHKEGGVIGVKLHEEEVRIDVGNPESYIYGLMKLWGNINEDMD